MRDREIDTMNTSSIDLICCALGALLMLMLFVSTLVRAKIERSARSRGQEMEQTQGKRGADEGFDIAPPDPLIATLEWTGLATLPLQLSAFPPAVQDEQTVPQLARALTEQEGLLRLENATYFGFFDRRAGRRDTYRLRLVVPCGSRSPLAAATDSKRPPGQAPDQSGIRAWQFRVDYPQAVPKIEKAHDPVLVLKAAFSRAAKLELHIWSGTTPWNGVGPMPLPAPEGSTQALITLKDLAAEAARSNQKIGLDLVRAVIRSRRAARTITPGQAGADSPAIAFHEPGEGQMRAIWISGFQPENVSSRRGAALVKLWADTILPELVAVAANPPTDTNTQHAAALKIISSIENARKRHVAGLAADEAIRWDDLTSGAIDRAVPGSGGWLGIARDYAAVYSGSDPVRGGNVEATFTIKEYPRSATGAPQAPRTWKFNVHGKPGSHRVQLGPGSSVLFSLPRS
jgi:hypothetical protein